MERTIRTVYYYLTNNSVESALQDISFTALVTNNPDVEDEAFEFIEKYKTQKGKTMESKIFEQEVWTDEDEEELVKYENSLTRSEFFREHAGWLVSGALAVVFAGIVALTVLGFMQLILKR